MRADFEQAIREQYTLFGDDEFALDQCMAALS
jgi:hypothetical protein